MSTRRRYRKKPDQFVTAVRLHLETEGFVYQKWGAPQRCKQGDWIVNNDGDVYSVDGEAFERTYRRLSPGVYVKATSIWAEVAEEAGAVDTKEGKSHYDAGDYIVSNHEDGSDTYCIGAKKFEAMYELDE